MTTTLLIPVLNEIDGVKAIMPKVKPEWCDQILFIDGGSTDGTCCWCRKNGYEVYVQHESGLRQGYAEVWPLIRGDVVITFSPDGNSDPQAIPRLIEAMSAYHCDMVIASRYMPPAKSADDSKMTAFGNWFFTTLINNLYCSTLTDAMVIYRAYRTELWNELNMSDDSAYATPERLFQTRIGCEPLLTVRALKNHKTIREIPSSEPARIGGVAKLQPWKWGASYLWQILADRFFE